MAFIVKLSFHRIGFKARFYLIIDFTFHSRVFSYMSHTIPDFTDNCLINIIKYGKDYYTSTETNYFHKIDPNTLETLQKVSALIDSFIRLIRLQLQTVQT